MTGEGNPLDERVWEVGWEGHELAQMKRMAGLTLRQKIEWLEDAQRLVERIRSAGPPSDDALP